MRRSIRPTDIHIDRFNPANGPTDEQIDEWIRNERARVMYRDKSRID